MLPSLQHPLNILRHNLPHPLDLALRRPQRVRLPGLRGTLLDHQPLELAIEAGTPVWGQVRKVGLLGRKLGKELLLEVAQEAEGDALAEVALGDH